MTDKMVLKCLNCGKTKAEHPTQYMDKWGYFIECFGNFQPCEVVSSPADLIEDGFGSAAPAICPTCGCRAIYICRPGDIRCGVCSDHNPKDYYTGSKCPECGMNAIHDGVCVYCFDSPVSKEPIREINPSNKEGGWEHRNHQYSDSPYCCACAYKEGFEAGKASREVPSIEAFTLITASESKDCKHPTLCSIKPLRANKNTEYYCEKCLVCGTEFCYYDSMANVLGRFNMSPPQSSAL